MQLPDLFSWKGIRYGGFQKRFLVYIFAHLVFNVKNKKMFSFSEQCCFPPHLAGHTCKQGYKHSEYGTAMTWDDALQSSLHHFEHKSYNLFTCNCHSFVANCLNRLCYRGSMEWNMVNVAALVLFKGRWIDWYAVLRSFSPFLIVLCFGMFMVGWPFLIGMFSFPVLLIGWFLLGTYGFKNLLEC